MTNKFFKKLGYGYILLPVIIFFLGWLKLWIAIPLCIILLIIFFRIVNNEQSKLLFASQLCLHNLLPAIIVILLWVYFSGIGGLVFQNKDHWWKNEIFNLLVTEKWPVVSDNRGLIFHYWNISCIQNGGLDFNFQVVQHNYSGSLTRQSMRG